MKRIRHETSEIARLRTAVGWLIAEARRARRIKDVTNAVLYLVECVRESLPLPDAPQDLATAIDPATPRVR